MDLPHVRLLRPPALKIDASTPCVLELNIPIRLPHKLDPSITVPPYHPGTTTADDLLDFQALPVLRRLMAAAVMDLFGAEHAAATLEAHQRDTPSAGFPLRLFHQVEATVHEANDVDVVTGYFKDYFGGDQHGPIEAYEEYPEEGRIAIIHSFTLNLVRGVTGGKELEEMNPRALVLHVVEEGDSSAVVRDEVVFRVREYTKDARKHWVSIPLGEEMKRADGLVYPLFPNCDMLEKGVAPGGRGQIS